MIKNVLQWSSLTLTIFVLSLTTMQGQSYPMDGSPITDCDGFFLDSGGSNGDYSPNENLTTTICSDGSQGTHIQLVFSGLTLGDGDGISFFDSDIVDPGAEFDLVLPNSPGQPFIIQATAANTSGCITVVFISDGVSEDAGWSADINCTVACQTIFADLVSADPAVSPVDTGWIDICPGDRVFFSGAGIYPQDGLTYNHSDASSSFAWNFGDGNTAVGPNVTNIFNEPGGYIVQMTITDTLGCRNSNFISQRVRVSTYPTYELGGDLDPTFCSGDTINLVAMVDTLSSSANVSVQPTEGSFTQDGSLSDTLLLPDGTGVSYQTSIGFTQFPPGATLTNPDDITGISLLMEHSYGGDLDIEVICPNGQSVYILDYPSGVGSTNFGEPYATNPVDGESNDLTPGIPYLYTFVNSGADFGTLPQTAGDFDHTYTTVPSNNDGDTHTYNDDYFPAGSYLPQEPFANLVGCPLNGEWTIRVQDNLGADNGWLFEWSIGFNAALFAIIETYTPTLVDWGWETNPTVIYQDQDSLSASPINAGTASYSFWVEDDFGCLNDTTINFQVLPITHPDCYNCDAQINEQADVLICENESADLDLSPTSPLMQSVTFESFPQYSFGASNHPISNPYGNTININSINPGLLTNPTTQIESVCIDMLTDWASDLNIYLESPNGDILTLSSGNGGGGDNYTNTCFSPDALTPIMAGAPPFTGSFQPESDWSVLTGNPVNGNWTLFVTDAFGINDMGEFISWSITFVAENEFTYNWSPGTGLSCTDCPTPTANPTVTTQYDITVTDSYNCLIEDQITVGVVDNIPAPMVACSQVDETLVFTWNAIFGFDSYEINIITNGVEGGWTGPYMDTQYTTAMGLSNNDEITVQVRVFFEDNTANCDIPFGDATCILSSCGLIASVMEVQPVSCFGLSDGTVTLEITSIVEPYTILIDNVNTGAADLTISDLSPGMHTVTIIDADACEFVSDFEILSPDELVASIAIIDEIDCNSNATGSLQASVIGGTADYTYAWSGPVNGNTSLFEGLVTGDYVLTITDANDCETTASITLNEPTALSLSFTPNNPSCFNTADGTVLVEVSGGTGNNYSYLWDDNTILDNASNLAPGNHCVTVTDENNCMIEACEELMAPPELIVDMIDTSPASCAAMEDGTATVTVSGGTGDLTYLWDDDNQQISEAAIFLGANTYNVQVTDAEGCTVMAEAIVTEPDELMLQLDTSPVNCNGGTDGTATVVPTGGTADYTYNWSNGGLEDMASNLTAGEVFVTVTDQNNCQADASIIVSQPQDAVTAVISQTVQGCFDAAQNEAVVTPGGGTGFGYSYNWSDTQNTATATGLAAGTVSVTVTDSNDCPVEASFDLEELEVIDFNLIVENPTCNGSNDGGLGVNQINGGTGTNESDYSYEWSTGSAAIAIVNLPGDIEYIVTVSDQQGCTAEQTVFLPNPEAVAFTIATTATSCFQGDDGQAIIENISGPNTDYSFLWGANAGSQVQATAISLSQGIYSVTVTDDLGCFAVGSAEITQPEELTLRLSAENVECFGQATGSISSLAGGGTPGYNYSWSTGAAENTLGNLTAGIYNLTVTDMNGCEEIQTIDIKQPDALEASAIGETTSCFDSRDGMITVSTIGGTPPFSYSLDNQTFFGSSTFIGLGAADYNIIIQDVNGCEFFTQATVNEPAEFSVDAGTDLTIIYGDSIELTQTVFNPQGDVEIVWYEPYDGTLSCLECPKPFASPAYTIDYEVYAIDENGCEDTDMLRLVVEKPKVVEVPTGFSPNGDGMNDLLLVHGRPGTRVKIFQIFDRWGELLYTQEEFDINDPTIGWDGTFRDETLNSGVFVWSLVVEHQDGTEESFQGQTTLIR